MKNKASNTLTIFKSYFLDFISLIYPNTCAICENELTANSKNICPFCFENLRFTFQEKNILDTSEAEKLFWGRQNVFQVFNLLVFHKKSSTQQILHALKYKGDQNLAIFMGELIAHRFKARESDLPIDAIVPIPLHDKKEFKRGYNQSMLICKGINNVNGVPVVQLLKRKRHHESQTKKDRFERWDNVKDIFEVVPSSVVGVKHVALVDDLLTTGSTLESGIMAIKTYNPDIRITVLTIAKA